MIGTVKQIKWANDLIALAQKELEVFNKSIDDDLEPEAVEAILRGFKKFINMNNASDIIYYGQAFKNRGKVDRLVVYKTMALIGGCKTTSKIKLKGCA